MLYEFKNTAQCKWIDEFYIACEQNKCYLKNIPKTFSL